MLFKKEKDIAQGNFVGIDIGETSIKLVDITYKEDKFYLNNYADMYTGPYEGKDIGDIAYLSESKLADAVKDIYIESKCKSKKINIGISMNECFVRVLPFPISAINMIDKLIDFELRKYIPILPNELSISYTEMYRDMNYVYVLVLAIKNKYLEKINNIMNINSMHEGYDYKVEPSIFGAIRYINYNPEPHLIIDLGASATTVVSIINNQIYSIDTIGKGINEIIVSIKNALLIKYTEARKIFFEVNINDEKNILIKDVFNLSTERILNEIINVKNNSELRYNTVYSSVTICGGGARILGIKEYLEKNLLLEVKISNGLDRLIISEALKQVVPGSTRLVNATGLALTFV